MNSEETMARLAGELKIEQKGWIRKSFFHLFSNRLVVLVKSKAAGKTFWYKQDYIESNLTYPKGRLEADMHDAAKKVISYFETKSKLKEAKKLQLENTITVKWDR